MLCVVLASRELEDRSAAMHKQRSAPWQTEPAKAPHWHKHWTLMALVPVRDGASAGTNLATESMTRMYSLQAEPRSKQQRRKWAVKANFAVKQP